MNTMETRMKIVLFTLLVVILVLFSLKLYMQNSLYIQGLKYTDLQNEIEMYKDKNMALNDNLLKQEAYTTIDQEAQANGFVAATIIYLR